MELANTFNRLTVGIEGWGHMGNFYYEVELVC